MDEVVKFGLNNYNSLPICLYLVLVIMSARYCYSYTHGKNFIFLKAENNTLFFVAQCIILFFYGWLLFKILMFFVWAYDALNNIGISGMKSSINEFLSKNNDNPLAWLLMLVIAYLLLHLKVFLDEFSRQLKIYLRSEARKLFNTLITKIKQASIKNEKENNINFKDLTEMQKKIIRDAYFSDDKSVFAVETSLIKDLCNRNILVAEEKSAKPVKVWLVFTTVKLYKKYFMLTDKAIKRLDNHSSNLSLAFDMSTP